MDLEKYLNSTQFLQFQDEKLRSHACGLVDRFLEKNLPVEKSQLRAIPIVFNSGGYKLLKDLANKQRTKENAKKKNKAFWDYIFKQVLDIAGKEDSLPALLRAEMTERGLLQNEDAADNKTERNRIKKENKNKMETVFNSLLGIYFEHFNCHYFFKRPGER